MNSTLYVGWMVSSVVVVGEAAADGEVVFFCLVGDAMLVFAEWVGFHVINYYM